MSTTSTITELVEYLNVCRDEYYNNNNSIITDKQYDELFDKLEQLEKESGIVLSNSPTQTVGYSVVSGFKEVTHFKPLLSLDKAHSYEEVQKFQGNKDVLYMHKLDGLTVQLTYDEDGNFVCAETRGNGIIGEDITNNAKTILGIPKSIPKLNRVVRITGEAIILKKDFDYVIRDWDSERKKKANQRNLASGSVRNYDSAVCASRKVRFVVWNANDLSSDGNMHSGLLTALQYGFTIVHYWRTNGEKTTDYIEKTFENMRNKAVNDGIPIDGIVTMFNNIEYGASLGSTSHHFKNGLAYKFYDEGYETTITDIEFSIGKTGVLTPVAVFEEVPMDSATVTRASLHNLSIMADLNIMRGDNVEIYRANDVIPQVRCNNTEHRLKDAYKDGIPYKCPYCYHDTSVDVSDDGIMNLICTNPHCSGRLLKKFTAFVAKNAMDIRGLSEKTIDRFIDVGYLEKYSDVYTLYTHSDQIALIPGFGEKSVKQIMDAIEDSKNTSLDRLLVAISIEGVGSQTAKDISEEFNNDVKEFTECLKSGQLYNRLSCVYGIGAVVANNVIEYFSNEDNRAEFYKLVSYLNIGNPVKVTSSCILAGKTFVVTGSLETYSSRQQLFDTIVANGGTTGSSVNKNTTYLINNDSTSNSSKNKKAHELGVSIITEAEFNDMISGVKQKIEIQKSVSKPSGKRKLF